MRGRLSLGTLARLLTMAAKEASLLRHTNLVKTTKRDWELGHQTLPVGSSLRGSPRFHVRASANTCAQLDSWETNPALSVGRYGLRQTVAARVRLPLPRYPRRPP